MINKIDNFESTSKTKAELLIEEAEKFNGENVGEIFATLASKINDEPTLEQMQKTILVNLCKDYMDQIDLIDKDSEMDYKTKKNKRHEHLNTFTDYLKRFF